MPQSAAYRNNYDTSSMAAKTVHEAASRLDKNYKVMARILELQAATEAALAVKRLWTMDRLVEAAEVNLDGAREGKQFGSANRSLELIGRLTGLIGGKQRQEPHVPITRVIFNLAPRVEPPADQIVEAAEYRELPPKPELAEGNVDAPKGFTGSVTGSRILRSSGLAAG